MSYVGDTRLYVCICPNPLPRPVKLFGCDMPGYPECQRCMRPVVTTAQPPPSPTIEGAVVPRSDQRSRRSRGSTRPGASAV